MPPKRTSILLIKFCCLGDIVFLTPTIRALHAAYPERSITLLVSSWVKEIIPCIPDVDGMIVSDAPFERSVTKRLFGAINMIRRIRELRPEIAIVAHRNTAFGFLAYLSGAKHRIGFDTTGFLTHTAVFDETAHEVDRYIAIVRSFGTEVRENATQLQAPHADRISLDQKLATCGIQQTDSPFVIFPGGGENPGMNLSIKRWTADGYRETIQRIRERLKLPVVLVGSTSDRDLCTDVAGGDQGVANLAGQLSLREIVALGHRCKVFLGGDSGPTHLAAAAGAATITLFGPTDPRLLAPRGEKHRVLWKQPQCAPCITPRTVLQKTYFNGKTFICHTGTHECMRDLDVEDVWNVIVEQISHIK